MTTKNNTATAQKTIRKDSKKLFGLNEQELQLVVGGTGVLPQPGPQKP